MIKERPIIFSGPMVQAILSGAKTQTRRVIQGGPYRKDIPGEMLQSLLKCPYGKVGDRLWVREKWRKGTTDSGLAVEYAVDGARTYLGDYPDRSTDWYWLADAPYRSPLFMPQWASRLRLEITEIRVQRLQEIGEVDARAEGVTPNWCGPLDGWDPAEHGYHDYRLAPDATGEESESACLLSARESFVTLWDAINAKRGYPWASDPWIWAITFRRVQP